jgi:sacsin
MLYLRLLEDRAESGDNSPYWPGNPIKLKGSQGTISKMVTDAVYNTAATSNASIFKSKYHEHTLAPCDAHLIGNMHHRVISEVLENIQPSNVVKPPSFATRRLTEVPESRVSLVTPKYVHTQILENPTRFDPSKLELPRLQELIGFLCKPQDGSCLIGLPLLLVEDGSFAKFDTSPDPCFYVAPLPVTEKAVFNCRRIVRHDLGTEMLLTINRINIKSISDSNIQILLNDYVTKNTTLEQADAETRLWIKRFWKVFKYLEISPDSIADYPLIPTLRPDSYVSRNHCRNSSVIVSNFVDNQLQAECLAQMHFTLVDSASIQRDVRSTLYHLELSVEKVLNKLFNSGGNISSMFNLLEWDLRSQWVGWIRSNLRNQSSQYFQKHPNYRSLPLWKNLDDFLISANEVNMLPSGVAISSVAPFVPSSTVGYDHLLKSMGIQPPSSILSILNIPKCLGDDEAYRRLLHVLLHHIPEQSSVPVPNSQRLIQDSSSLYSSRDDLFLAAFGRDSEKFILPSFRALELQLERHGLQRQHDLNIASFKTCLHAFQNATGNDLGDRAAIIFRIFSEDLPLYVNSSSDNEWTMLGDLRFIPRLSPPQPLAGVGNVSKYLAPHVRYLPEVVSPCELVREEFKAIAWSQRAIYRTEPHTRVLMLHPSLSVPSATEVVCCRHCGFICLS